MGEGCRELDRSIGMFVFGVWRRSDERKSDGKRIGKSG